VIVDFYGRYVVGWMVVDRESSDLARHLLKATIEEQDVDPEQLTIHSDRGSSPRAREPDAEEHDIESARGKKNVEPTLAASDLHGGAKSGERVVPGG